MSKWIFLSLPFSLDLSTDFLFSGVACIFGSVEKDADLHLSMFLEKDDKKDSPKNLKSMLCDSS